MTIWEMKVALSHLNSIKTKHGNEMCFMLRKNNWRWTSPSIINNQKIRQIPLSPSQPLAPGCKYVGLSKRLFA